jgi:predicted PurR-regulated permease PerM
MDHDPHRLLRAWLPHLLTVAVLGLFVWLMVQVFAPLTEPLLLAAALALLTTPVLYQPVLLALTRLTPRLPDTVKRKIAGIIATVLLVAMMVFPFLLMMGSMGATVDLVFGLAAGNTVHLDRLESLVHEQVVRIDQLFPALGLNQSAISERVRELVAEAMDFGPAFLSFLFAGTGAVAHLALALISLSFFYSEGPRLTVALLRYSPLDHDQQQRLVQRHRHVVYRLLHDTVGIALVKGMVLAGIAWSVDLVLGTGKLPFLPVMLIASVLTLLPVVGMTMVWLPLAGLLWSLDHRVGAVLLGATSFTAHLSLEWLRNRLGSRIDERDAWTGFLLFLGLLGGLLSYGLKGLVIGPMAVVLVSTTMSFWLPLYGLGNPSESIERVKRDLEAMTPSARPPPNDDG